MGHRLMQGIIPRGVSSQLGRGERKRGCIPFSVNAVTNTRPLVRRTITLEYMEFHANMHICTNCNERFQISLWNVSLCICICFGGFRNDWYLGDSRHSRFHHQFREIKYYIRVFWGEAFIENWKVIVPFLKSMQGEVMFLVSKSIIDSCFQLIFV